MNWKKKKRYSNEVLTFETYVRYPGIQIINKTYYGTFSISNC